MKGRLVVFEGIDGAGKDTQIQKLTAYLSKTNKKHQVVHYPDTENAIGTLIHKFLHKEYDFSPEIQFLLYATDMLKDREKILNSIESGVIVIANRYIASTLSYQGASLTIALTRRSPEYNVGNPRTHTWGGIYLVYRRQ